MKYVLIFLFPVVCVALCRAYELAFAALGCTSYSSQFFAFVFTVGTYIATGFAYWESK